MSEERTVTEADLQAYADGRLAEARLAGGGRWLAARPEEAERVTAYRQLGDELHGVYAAVLDEPVPQRLERAARRRWRWRTAAAAAGLVALGGLIRGAWRPGAARVAGAGSRAGGGLVRAPGGSGACDICARGAPPGRGRR